MTGVNDKKLVGYQKARQVASAAGAPPVEQVIADFGLTPGFAACLTAVVALWKKDNERFAEVLEGVYNDATNSPLERALAAEYVKSAKSGEERIGWAERALALVPELGPEDGRHITVKVRFGLWDDGVESWTFEEVREALTFLIDIGSFDAPGRVLAWGKKLEEDGDSYVEWLERVTALDLDTTAANIFWMGKAREKLAELSQG